MFPNLQPSETFPSRRNVANIARGLNALNDLNIVVSAPKSAADIDYQTRFWLNSAVAPQDLRETLVNPTTITPPDPIITHPGKGQCLNAIADANLAFDQADRIVRANWALKRGNHSAASFILGRPVTAEEIQAQSITPETAVSSKTGERVAIAPKINQNGGPTVKGGFASAQQKFWHLLSYLWTRARQQGKDAAWYQSTKTRISYLIPNIRNADVNGPNAWTNVTTAVQREINQLDHENGGVQHSDMHQDKIPSFDNIPENANQELVDQMGKNNDIPDTDITFTGDFLSYRGDPTVLGAQALAPPLTPRGQISSSVFAAQQQGNRNALYSDITDRSAVPLSLRRPLEAPIYGDRNLAPRPQQKGFKAEIQTTSKQANVSMNNINSREDRYLANLPDSKTDIEMPDYSRSRQEEIDYYAALRESERVIERAQRELDESYSNVTDLRDIPLRWKLPGLAKEEKQKEEKYQSPPPLEIVPENLNMLGENEILTSDELVRRFTTPVKADRITSLTKEIDDLGLQHERIQTQLQRNPDNMNRPMLERRRHELISQLADKHHEITKHLLGSGLKIRNPIIKPKKMSKKKRDKLVNKLKQMKGKHEALANFVRTHSIKYAPQPGKNLVVNNSDTVFGNTAPFTSALMRRTGQDAVPIYGHIEPAGGGQHVFTEPTVRDMTMNPDVTERLVADPMKNPSVDNDLSWWDQFPTRGTLPYGRLFVHARPFNKGILSIADGKGRKVKGFKNRKMSPALHTTISRVLNRHVHAGRGDGLTHDEHSYVNELHMRAGLPLLSGGLTNVTDPKKKLLEICGEIDAGNNNPALVAQLKTISTKLRDQGIITPQLYELCASHF